MNIRAGCQGANANVRAAVQPDPIRLQSTLLQPGRPLALRPCVIGAQGKHPEKTAQRVKYIGMKARRPKPNQTRTPAFGQGR